MANLRPLGNRLIVEPIRRQTLPGGVIITPDNYLPDDQEFRVIGVGSGRLLKNGTREPIPIEPGWRVISKTYNIAMAAHIEHEGHHYRVMNVDDVCFVLPP